MTNCFSFFCPIFSEKMFYNLQEIESEIILLQRDLKNVLRALDKYSEAKIINLSDSFFKKLPEINAELWLDAKSINEGDPAAESIDEVILAYPGFLANCYVSSCSRFV